MALSRYNGTTGLGMHMRQGKENVEGILSKPGIGKQPLRSLSHKGPLGNISNAGKTQGPTELKKGLRDSTNVAKSSSVSTKQVSTHCAKEHLPHKPDPKKEIEKTEAKDLICEQAFSKQLINVQDIDKDDHENPQLVSEYVNSIYDYMRDLERRFPIKNRYLDGSDINGRMRGILVDWLVQVHLRFHLLQETLYLTVAIIDRFLQVQKVARSKLQLVGVTAMLIASKYEEMYAPEIADFVYITDNAYTKADIRKTECIILKTLDFNLGRPLPLHFLRRNSKAGEVDATKHTLAKYLMELTMVDYDMVHLHPSEVAAASLCLAMRVLDEDTGAWNETLNFYSKYSEMDLLPIMQQMALLVTKASAGKLTAIKTKYQSSKFMRISLIPELKSQIIQEMAETVAK